MQRCIAFAVFIAAALTGAGAQAACPPETAKPKTHAAKTGLAAQGCVDLNAVPQISEHIVDAEQTAPVQKKPGYTPPPTTKYEGPILGLTKPEPGVKPAPTVGYHWSLE